MKKMTGILSSFALSSTRLIGVASMCAALWGATSVQTMTRDNGAPVGDDQNAQTAGPNGPILLQDYHLIQKLQRFDRERIPERVVHAHGIGAFGEFVSSGDASDITRATAFASPGKTTPVFVRFSTVLLQKGSPETVREPRGFATKFYSDQGNWDLVCNNLPSFFIRDPIKFPDMVHAFKPSPITNVQDINRIFDFLSFAPESTLAVTQLFSDLGIPASYRQMDGNSVTAYKFVNARGEVNYVKFHWKAQEGIKTLSDAEAAKIQARDVNNLSTDLYQAISKGEFPKWDLYVQLLSPKDFDKFDFNPLEATKLWPGIPERKLGTMTLNKIPHNFFQTTEEVAFSVSNLIPGIEPSEDRILQARLFAMPDTQLHRLGTNFNQIPINRPKVPVHNYNQDGQGDQGMRQGDNYLQSVNATLKEDPQSRYVETPLNGTTQQRPILKQANFVQAGAFYRSLDDTGKQHLIDNLAGALKGVSDHTVTLRMLSFFYKADPNYGTGVADKLGFDLAAVKEQAATLSDD